MHKTAIIIPARFNSSRFPGKSLEMIDEFNVIQSVYLRAKQVKQADIVIVATDDSRIEKTIIDIGGRALITNEKHINGTSRIAELAKLMSDYAYIVNLQGDEPFINPNDVDNLILRLKKSKSSILTLMKKCNIEENNNSNVVKIKTDKNGLAVLFSRVEVQIEKDKGVYKHIGIYGFRRDVLLELVKLPLHPMEISVRLEQLRWLENGYGIQVFETENESIGIDVPKDLIKARAYYKLQQQT
ncbi:MAG: 3-deoxy-manno-octulosonate cytidylyltransferase [Saprospiraceae bacterium]